VSYLSLCANQRLGGCKASLSFFCAVELWLRLTLVFEISFGVWLSLFLLKEKVTKKFKDNPIAPRVCPANATDTL
jgi:hypothetical protein